MLSDGRTALGGDADPAPAAAAVVVVVAARSFVLCSLPFILSRARAKGTTAIVSTIKRQYLMQPEVGSAYTKVVKTRLVANTIKAR